MKGATATIRQSQGAGLHDGGACTLNGSDPRGDPLLAGAFDKQALGQCTLNVLPPGVYEEQALGARNARTAPRRVSRETRQPGHDHTRRNA